ncbi:ice nucleation protein [Xanthomonas oryzae pv. leersiae]|uniref:Ice nucleation protein n=1 Tax=Xanthomonas oryzae pv. leersiae TaxID=3112258 RepID=A0AAJ6GU42_9XANT|nr:ice nucleation protein [Xanthomonas oryzae]WIX06334.1 ice nucleation protein [Xanthomonas oryzae pv. oryzae]
MKKFGITHVYEQHVRSLRIDLTEKRSGRMQALAGYRQAGKWLDRLVVGQGTNAHLNMHADAHWVVCMVETADIIWLGEEGMIKFPKADVVYAGNRAGAMSCVAADIEQHSPPKPEPPADSVIAAEFTPKAPHAQFTAPAVESGAPFTAPLPPLNGIGPQAAQPSSAALRTREIAPMAARSSAPIRLWEYRDCGSRLRVDRRLWQHRRGRIRQHHRGRLWQSPNAGGGSTLTAGDGSTSTAGADSTLIAVMAARRPPAAKAR